MEALFVCCLRTKKKKNVYSICFHLKYTHSFPASDFGAVDGREGSAFKLSSPPLS